MPESEHTPKPYPARKKTNYKDLVKSIASFIQNIEALEDKTPTGVLSQILSRANDFLTWDQIREIVENTQNILMSCGFDDYEWH